jgi:precorrin-3B synthase
MLTGDGLLVRLLPTGTIALGAFAALCQAARTHGNGVIEITARGSIQIRGLNVASATHFATAVAALDIAAADGIAVLASPLTGLDDTEVLNAGLLAAEVRTALTHTSLATRLASKASVAIDGGGALTLDDLDADVRLRATLTNGIVALDVGIGGNTMSAAKLGVVAPNDGVETAMRLLEVIAQHGRAARARDVLAGEGIAIFRTAMADLILNSARPRESGDPPPPFPPPLAGEGHEGGLGGNERKRSDAIGPHALRDGSLAWGIGLAFGHADATSLERLIEHARSAGATGMRAAPGRVLLTIGVTQRSAPSFVAAAERLGFIVRADDPRRHVVACAGAPICASAHIAARAMAPTIAASAAPYLGAAHTIHISGCAKGCAHPAAAALTVVGTPSGCALIVRGATRDATREIVPIGELAGSVTKLIQDKKREDGHV